MTDENENGQPNSSDTFAVRRKETSSATAENDSNRRHIQGAVDNRKRQRQEKNKKKEDRA